MRKEPKKQDWEDYANNLETRKGSMLDYLIFCPTKHLNPGRIFNLNKSPKVPYPTNYKKNELKRTTIY
jgi:hypothetical protein